MVNDCIWVSYHDDILARGYWDQGQLEDIFKLGEYIHYNGFGEWSENVAAHNGAVVVINGRTHYEPQDIEKLNNDLSLLKWVVLIVTGDEESLFPSQDIHHPLLKMWVQLPRLGKHNDVYRMPNGYRPTTRHIFNKTYPAERHLDWCFAGQVTHERRQECADVLKTLLNGAYIETKTFGEEAVPYPDYLNTMRTSKFAPCPSGPESPDSFRVWEALEAGCIPIVDSHSTNNPVDGFWEYLLGDDLPFPVVKEWSELPDLLPVLLRDYPHNANRVFAWWQVYKRQMRKELERNVKQWV